MSGLTSVASPGGLRLMWATACRAMSFSWLAEFETVRDRVDPSRRVHSDMTRRLAIRAAA